MVIVTNPACKDGAAARISSTIKRFAKTLIGRPFLPPFRGSLGNVWQLCEQMRSFFNEIIGKLPLESCCLFGPCVCPAVCVRPCKCLSVCLDLCVCLFLSLSGCLCLCMSVSFSLSVPAYVFVSGNVCVCLSMYVVLYVCECLCMLVSICLSLYICLSVSTYAYASTCFLSLIIKCKELLLLVIAENVFR